MRDPALFPDHSTHVIPVETSQSWVFLTDRFAYKLKKPICRPLIDLSALAAREANAKAEVRLNRRLAPRIYLGVISLTEGGAGQLELGGAGKIVDWLVWMRRLPDQLMLDNLLTGQTLPQARLRTLADRLARFYIGAPRVDLSGSIYRQRLRAELMLNHTALTTDGSMLPPGRIQALHKRAFHFLDNYQALLDARAEEGCLVEGHGDLRPEHVCLLGHPVIFDCLEFSERLRQVDPLDDLAFLAIGCEQLGAPHVGRELYRAYRTWSGDSAPSSLIDFYCTFRASMRARFAIAHLPGLPPSARGACTQKALSFLRIAERHASVLK